MGKRIYIQFYNANSGESITLPITPEQIEIPKEKDIKTYNILNYGEVAIKGNYQLERISMSGILPDEDTYFALLASLVKQLEYKPYSLQETRDMIDRWITNDDVVRVIVSGRLNKEFLIQRNTSTIREYSTSEPFNIDIIEYRDPKRENKTATVTENRNRVKLKQRAIKKYVPAQFVGKTGQTLYKLAWLTYGGRVKELMDKNGLTNPNMSIAGMVVEMLPL